MPTEKLRALRLTYKGAYTDYMASVQALAEAGRRGELPSSETLSQEARAFDDMLRARAAFLDALVEAGA